MTLIGAGMDGDAVRAGFQADPGETHDVRNVDGTGVPERGNLVYVDAELCHLLREEKIDRREPPAPGCGNIRGRGKLGRELVDSR
jgi:hypothetical protein